VLDRHVLGSLEGGDCREEAELVGSVAEVEDQGGVGGDPEVDLAPVRVDGRHGEELVEELPHLAVVRIGENLALDAPQQLAADVVEVGQAGLCPVGVEGEPGEVELEGFDGRGRQRLGRRGEPEDGGEQRRGTAVQVPHPVGPVHHDEWVRLVVGLQQLQRLGHGGSSPSDSS
jgi:hypothetical protein